MIMKPAKSCAAPRKLVMRRMCTETCTRVGPSTCASMRHCSSLTSASTHNTRTTYALTHTRARGHTSVAFTQHRCTKKCKSTCPHARTRASVSVIHTTVHAHKRNSSVSGPRCHSTCARAPASADFANTIFGMIVMGATATAISALATRLPMNRPRLCPQLLLHTSVSVRRLLGQRALRRTGNSVCERTDT